jgi:uncharacterized protein (DUF1501 family)
MTDNYNRQDLPDPQRRRLLQVMGGLLFASTCPFSYGRLWAAASGSNANHPRLLVVFLRGAYDAANVLIPYRSADYYRLRPNIAIPAPDAANPKSAIRLDEQWALHPALRESLYPLWQKDELAFIPFAGSNDSSRSHFETQERIEAGLDEHTSLTNQGGFLARLDTELGQPASIAFTAQLPVIFTGEVTVPNLALRDAGKAPFDVRQSNLLSALYKGHPYEEKVKSGLQMRQEVASMLADEMQAASRGAVSAAGFELEARRMGKLMRDYYKIGFVDVGGWDTHVNEGGSEGQLANLLGNLSRGLVSFKEELGPAAWQESTVLVISEFGRTFRENGNRGTDHGHGTVYWLMGGKVKGGRILGDQVEVAEGTLFQKRDYVVLNEYRSVIGGLLLNLYGLDRQQLERIFPGANPKILAAV